MAMSVVINSEKKILHVTLDGCVTSETAAKVLAEYSQLIAKITPKEYSLLIDCTEMGVFQQDAVLTFGKLYRLYMSTGFKNIVLIKSKNAIQNMQLNKAAKDVPGFTGIFVDNMAEALKACIESSRIRIC